MSIPRTVGARAVRPILSLDHDEARRRVINLYKAWYRQLPYIIADFHLPKTEQQLRDKLRDEFYKNKDVKDIRVIDILVVKGQNELKETAKLWKQECHIMTYFKETHEKKPTEFLNKFFNGSD